MKLAADARSREKSVRRERGSRRYILWRDAVGTEI